MSRRASIRKVQGSELPPDGSPISAFPIGACVLVDHGGEVAWHLVLFYIGGDGPPFCGRMSHPPSSPRWNSQMGDSRSIPESTLVHSSAWPLRAKATEDAGGRERDPLKSDVAPGEASLDLFSALVEGDGDAGRERPPPGDPVHGSLMLGHVASAR